VAPGGIRRVALAGSPVLAAVFVAACDRGCSAVLGGHAAEGRGLGSLGKDLPISGIDCPDGLARCEEGVISVSRLAAVPTPCFGPPESCRCPWERVTDCAGPCAADGVEVVIERDAAAQLCAPNGAAAFAVPALVPVPSPAPCEEGDRYECTDAAVIECTSNSIAGHCLRGCRRDGAAVDDDRVSRVAAFAILCSR